MYLNFSACDCTVDDENARMALNDMINDSISMFYKQYALYLGNETAKQLIEANVKADDAIRSLRLCCATVAEVLESLEIAGDNNHPLANVKGVSIYRQIVPYFIDCSSYVNLLSLSLTDLSSGRRI